MAGARRGPSASNGVSQQIRSAPCPDYQRRSTSNGPRGGDDAGNDERARTGWPVLRQSQIIPSLWMKLRTARAVAKQS